MGIIFIFIPIIGTRRGEGGEEGGGEGGEEEEESRRRRGGGEENKRGLKLTLYTGECLETLLSAYLCWEIVPFK